MTAGYDSFTPVAVPPPRRVDDTGSHHIGHPRPARQVGPELLSGWGDPAPRRPVERSAGGGRSGRFAMVAVLVVLALVAGGQAYQMNRLGSRLDAADRRLGQVVAAQQAASTQLERQAARSFDPQAISSAVLPSVFRVRAGDFTGTAFAVGARGDDGQTNLFTNYHVVASVFEAGRRQVFLERDGEQIPARIVKVSKGKDLARLQVGRKIGGLPTATARVQPGQQVVVVGAPLGLEDTVTTGVVSAFRQQGDGTGPAIQFDAPINPGNSGGPVINAAKQVVGLATAKARDAEGIGLAIPITTACDTFDVC